MPRFVIQEHVVGDESHWDLMLQQGDTLATWQVLIEPINWRTGAIECCRLSDHRLKYLSYQGEISRGRGEVRIVDSGQYQPIEVKEDYWHVSINGGKVNGVLTLKLIQDQQWRLEFQEEPIK